MTNVFASHWDVISAGVCIQSFKYYFHLHWIPEPPETCISSASYVKPKQWYNERQTLKHCILVACWWFLELFPLRNQHLPQTQINHLHGQWSPFVGRKKSSEFVFAFALVTVIDSKTLLVLKYCWRNRNISYICWLVVFYLPKPLLFRLTNSHTNPRSFQVLEHPILEDTNIIN